MSNCFLYRKVDLLDGIRTNGLNYCISNLENATIRFGRENYLSDGSVDMSSLRDVTKISEQFNFRLDENIPRYLREKQRSMDNIENAFRELSIELSRSSENRETERRLSEERRKRYIPKGRFTSNLTAEELEMERPSRFGISRVIDA